MILGRSLERIIDIIGEFFAFATITLILVLYINGKVGFINPETTNILAYVRELAIVVTVGLKALEFALKRNIFIAVFCLAIIVAVVVLIFIPGMIPGWSFQALLS